MDGKVMKLLIAFDGSNSSETALSELKRAGLPQMAEALVLTVADVILPSAEAVDQPDPEWMAAVLEKAHRRAAEAVEKSHAIALRASKTVQAEFPNWRVRAEACADSPAWGVVKRVEEWKADLVVVGSHNRSALGRLTFGSVAQRFWITHPLRSESREVTRGLKALLYGLLPVKMDHQARKLP